MVQFDVNGKTKKRVRLVESSSFPVQPVMLALNKQITLKCNSVRNIPVPELARSSFWFSNNTLALTIIINNHVSRMAPLTTTLV